MKGDSFFNMVAILLSYFTSVIFAVIMDDRFVNMALVLSAYLTSMIFAIIMIREILRNCKGGTYTAQLILMLLCGCFLVLILPDLVVFFTKH